MEERAEGKYRIFYNSIGNTLRRDNIVQTLPGQTSIGSGIPTTEFDAPYLTESYRNLISAWSNKLHVLEAFDGTHYFNFPGEVAASTDGFFSGFFNTANNSIEINLQPFQLNYLQAAYDRLMESTYANLVLQTRLKPYLDAIETIIDDKGLHYDTSRMSQLLAQQRMADPEGYLTDLLELDRYANGFLSLTNWSGLADFDETIQTLPQTARISALLDEFKVRRFGEGNDKIVAGQEAAILLLGSGDDEVSGSNGDDRLFGQDGDDRLTGGDGNDLLSGGAGNDVLTGQYGGDTYVFGRGDGQDTIIEDSWIQG